MRRYRCPCGYIYDPETGDAQTRIPPGTAFDDLPYDWICPRCGYEKEYFIALAEVESVQTPEKGTEP